MFPAFLSVRYVLSIVVPFKQCALQSVWNVRCACTRTETSSFFARENFFDDSVISSTPMPSVLRGPTDKYKGEPHTRKSSAPLLRCSEEDRFRSCHCVHVQRPEGRHVRMELSLCFPDVDHFCIHSPSRAKHRDVGFHLFSFGARSRQVKEETFSESDPLHPSCVNLCTSCLLPSFSALCSSDSREVLRAAANCLGHLRNCQFNVMSLCRACRCAV